MSNNGHYKLNIKSFGEQGVKIEMSRKFGVSGFVSVAVVLASIVIFIFLGSGEGFVLQMDMCLPLAMAVAMLGFIYHHLTRICKETVLIATNLGVTITRTSLLSSSVRFFDVQYIKDIVIIEAVSMQSIICQLVLLQRKSAADNKLEALYPLFQSFQPSIDDLKTIYREAQSRLGDEEDR